MEFNERTMNGEPLAAHSQANEDLGVPGRADVPVGTANGQANERAVNDEPLAAHSQANVYLGVPGRADVPVGTANGQPTGKP
jgi:hypothetical protein